MKLHRLFIILILAVGVTGCGLTVSDYDDAIMDGIASLNLNKPDKALESFERAIRIDPKPSTGYLGRANALNTLGKYERSIRDYNRAIDIDPNVANAYVNRGIAYAKLGELKKAIADYEKALALDPKIDNPPTFVKRLFSNDPNTDKGVRKHLEALKKQVGES